MDISPKVSMYLNIAVAVLGVLGAGVMPHYIPDGVQKDVAETASWLLAVYGSVNAALHGVSSAAPGPLAK